jgi:signal transduction histidine kinase
MEESKGARLNVEGVLDACSKPLLVLDESLCVKYANKSFYAAYGFAEGDVIRSRIFDLGAGVWREPALRRLLEDTLPPAGPATVAEEVRVGTSTGQSIRLRASRGAGGDDLILVAEPVLVPLLAEQFFEAALNALQAHIAVVDSDGAIVAVNAAWERFARENGASAGAMSIGCNYLDVCDRTVGEGEEDAAAAAHGIRSVLAGHEVVFCLEYACHAPREERWFEMRVSRFSGAGHTCAAIMHDNITERKLLERELLRISEEERQRIGKDLHDGLGSHLTGVALLLQAFAEETGPEQDIRPENLQPIARLVSQAVEQVRMLSRGLNPVKLETEGLAAALYELANGVQTVFGIKCVCRAEEGLPALQSEVATQLYRIAQEAVHNAAKHARSSSISVQLAREGPRLVLSVGDDGVGLARARQYPGGMGLRIMPYRARLIGGSFSISEPDGGGTLVTCSVPLRRAQAHHRA